VASYRCTHVDGIRPDQKKISQVMEQMNGCHLTMLLQVALYGGQFIWTRRTETPILIDIHQVLFGICEP